MEDYILVEMIEHCSRCGEKHKILPFVKFTNPIVVGDKTFEYYSVCPNNGEPIILRLYDE